MTATLDPMTVAIGQSDANFLKSYLVNTRVYGVVVPAGSPPEFLATFEIQGDQGTLVIAVAVGPQGDPGADAFALILMDDDTIDSPLNLPKAMTQADLGKAWIIDDVDVNNNIVGASMYVWYGSRFRQIMLGSPGPQGPVPIITPSLVVLPPGQASKMVPGGNPWEPTMEFDLSLPAGPAGPAAALALCPDIDFSTHPPQPGDVLGHTGTYKQGLLPPPGGLVAKAVSGGGALAAGPRFYVVTAVNANGETTVSNEATITALANGTVTLVWNAVGSGNFGPTHYNIYGSNTSGGEVLIGTVSGSTLEWVDTGAGGGTTAVNPPTTNTATVQFPVWVPVSIAQLLPGPFSMPEGSFTAFSGISQAAAIGSFAIPPQPFPWTPIAWGHLGAFGVELSPNPLMIGAEVLLGHPTTGALIGRGFGNALGEVEIKPHYSTPAQPNVAITPTNQHALVPANHTNPQQGTVYVNLYNDGQIGLYQFSPTDAQVFLLLMPQ